MVLNPNNNINNLIDNEVFYHHYQPIYNLEKNVLIGIEVLFRSEFKSPEIAFIEAQAAHRLYELETKSLSTALQSKALRILDKSYLVFVNVYPSTIINPNFLRFIKNAIINSSIKPEQIVIELNENEVIENFSYFAKCIVELKKNGFLIALDDVGKRFSSLRRIIELNPDYIKMDNYFGFDLSKSKQKQEMVKSILTYCKNTKTKFILEGIEYKRDLIIAKGLGVPNGQGFLLGKPGPMGTFQSINASNY